jgi:hypothetical protein
MKPVPAVTMLTAIARNPPRKRGPHTRFAGAKVRRRQPLRNKALCA